MTPPKPVDLANMDIVEILNKVSKKWPLAIKNEIRCLLRVAIYEILSLRARVKELEDGK